MRTTLTKSSVQRLQWLWLFTNHYYIGVSYFCVMDEFGNICKVDPWQTVISLNGGEVHA